MRSKHYKLIFFAHNGTGPFTCVFCDNEVQAPWIANQADPLVVHHVDHDSTNDSPENLAPAHSSCHLVHHANDGNGGDRARRGWATRRKNGNGQPTEETRAKLRAAQTRRIEQADHTYRELLSDAGRKGGTASGVTRRKRQNT